MRTKTIRTMLLLCATLLLTAAGPARAQEKKTYTLAVIPQARSVEVIEKWTPLVKRLSQDLGIELEIVPYNSMAQFEADIVKGVPDFAYMNPYQATTIKGYVPLVRDKGPLVGILVAKKGGAVSTLKDVSGKELAFPDPNAFAASLYLRALLMEKEKITFTPTYVKTHGNVYRSVVYDRAAAGGGVKTTLVKEPDDVKGHLAVIYETPGTASHPLSAHTRVPEPLRKKMAKAVLALASDARGKSMLSSAQLPDPEEADFQRDYAPLRKLGIEKYISKE
jgi:phosphonate transport system substrate-binding protein